MKKRIASLIFCILIISWCITGCGLSDLGINLATDSTSDERNIESLDEGEKNQPEDYVEPATEDSDSDNQGETLQPEESLDEPSTEGETDGNDSYGEEETSSGVTFDSLRVYSEEEISGADLVSRGLYAYSLLGPEDRRIYNQMYLGLMEMTPGANIDTSNSDTINRIFQCVMMDHPEIFWTTGYTYTKYTVGDDIRAVGFTGTYTMGDAVRQSRQTAIDNYVNTCLSGMPAGDDYQKIKYVYEYIILNTEYVVDSPDNQNICSVCINGKSVCQGYAKTTQYILNKAGIMCTLVSGTAKSENMGNQSHTWNLVNSNGAYYYVDTTWGDASYSVAEGAQANIPQISYDYLCVPSNELFKTHSLGTPVAMPNCSSMQDNYYVREGAYFTGVSEEQLQTLFNRAYELGKTSVLIKASDANVYSEMRSYLLDNQNVFRFLKAGTGTVSYWENANSNTIAINL